MYDPWQLIVCLVIHAFLLKKSHIHAQGVLVRLLYFVGGEAATLVEAYGTMFLSGKRLNREELATGKCLSSGQVFYLLDKKIADMLTSPFLLNCQIGNIHCRIPGLGIECFFVIPSHIRCTCHRYTRLQFFLVISVKVKRIKTESKNSYQFFLMSHRICLAEMILYTQAKITPNEMIHRFNSGMKIMKDFEIFQYPYA